MSTTTKDSVYGVMKWNDLEEAFVGSVEFFESKRIEIFVFCYSPMDFIEVRQTHDVLKKFRADEMAIRTFITTDLLDDYNRDFRKKHDKKLSFNELRDKIEIESISFDYGKADIFYKTDLFDGYTIIVHADKEGKLINVELI